MSIIKIKFRSYLYQRTYSNKYEKNREKERKVSSDCSVVFLKMEAEELKL